MCRDVKNVRKKGTEAFWLPKDYIMVSLIYVIKMLNGLIIQVNAQLTKPIKTFLNLFANSFVKTQLKYFFRVIKIVYI